MYEENFNRGWLYIGDILSGLKLPNLKKDEFHLVSQSNDDKTYSVRLMMPTDFFVYLSHECDFNENKRQYFILAPMFGIPADVRRRTDDFHRLINSNDVKAHPNYLNLFYYSPSPPRFSEDKLMDFTRVISVPVTLRQQLLESKVLELTLKNRLLIKDKLGYYFSHEEK